MVNKTKETTRDKLHQIIFEADTPLGKMFDILLLVFIMLSVFVVMIDSVPQIHSKMSDLFYGIEWFFTIAFTIEYILRIYTVNKPFKNYIFSFYGIIDLLAILPTYLSIIIVGSQYLMVIRIFRMIRIFRILKLGRFIGATELLKNSFMASRHKILVFLEVVMTVVFLMGSLMYLIEGPESGFTSIPRGIYWAIVTLTTVGYGDIAPVTVAGQFIASIVMILGYAIIAVPTGIITVEMQKAETKSQQLNTQVCDNCYFDKHDDDAKYCKRCGTKL
ncbi:MAG: ion transporter [Bacteroidetes bacterium]|nr:MAG: ion transporter [Bacteroidota bacterium]